MYTYTHTKLHQQAAASNDGGLHAATSRSMQCAHVLATRFGHMRMKMNGQVGRKCLCPID